MNLTGTIKPPEIPANVPSHVQWLLGQGAGTWFCMDPTSNPTEYNIKRFNPKGELDCDRIFQVVNNGLIFDCNKPYEFIHISHCATCKVVQNETIFTFNYIQHHD